MIGAVLVDRPAIAERGLVVSPLEHEGMSAEERRALRAWQKRTLNELYEADCVAREEAGLEVLSRKSFMGKAGHRTSVACCATCGGTVQQFTPGCKRCKYRKYFRDWTRNRDAERRFLARSQAAEAVVTLVAA